MGPPLRRTLLAASALAALCAAPSIAGAQPSPDAAPFRWPRFIDRPLSLPHGQVGVIYGFGLVASGITSREVAGGGFHVGVAAGFGPRFEVEAGFGVRVPAEGTELAPERVSRVNREEVFQVGGDFIANPFLRLRWAALDRPGFPLRAGVELRAVGAIADQTAFSTGFGFPLHLTLGPVRVETGLFMQFVLSDTARVKNVLDVPARVWLQVAPRIAAGVITGVMVSNAGRSGEDRSDSQSETRVPFALAGAFRVGQATDFLVQWTLPAAHPFGADVMGVGVAMQSRLR